MNKAKSMPTVVSHRMVLKKKNEAKWESSGHFARQQVTE
jgi:hypothetical protein